MKFIWDFQFWHYDAPAISFLEKIFNKIHWAEFLHHYSLITMTKSLSHCFPGRCIAAACTFPVHFYSGAGAKISEICTIICRFYPIARCFRVQMIRATCTNFSLGPIALSIPGIIFHFFAFARRDLRCSTYVAAPPGNQRVSPNFLPSASRR